MHVMVGLYCTDPVTGRLAWLRAEDVHRVLRAEDVGRRVWNMSTRAANEVDDS